MYVDSTNRQQIYRSVFKDNPNGQVVLDDIKLTIKRHIRELQSRDSASYMDPNASHWALAQLEVLERILGILNNTNVNAITPE